MQFQIIDTQQPVQFQPVTVQITLSSEDDLRWFYHLMNFQGKEIKAAYGQSSIGAFDQRFREFQVPDKRALFRAIKEEASRQNVTL